MRFPSTWMWEHGLEQIRGNEALAGERPFARFGERSAPGQGKLDSELVAISDSKPSLLDLKGIRS